VTTPPDFATLCNFRDLGGYPTADGRVTRWRRLYRADGLQRLAGADLEVIRGRGLRTVVDLRRPEEIAERGMFPVADHPVDLHNLSVLDVLWGTPGRDVICGFGGDDIIFARGGADTVKGGALRTTFETVPDAPVTSFKLDLLGGAKGLLQNSKSLCGKPKRADVSMTGQNGEVVNSKPQLQVNCGKSRLKRQNRKGGGSR